jgi:hypothetical protein
MRMDAEAHQVSKWRHPRVDHGRAAMSIQTRMAVEQSRPMPQCSESGVSVRYETKVLPHWDRQEWAAVPHAFTYEIAWIPERQCWRSFLCSVSKVG